MYYNTIEEIRERIANRANFYEGLLEIAPDHEIEGVVEGLSLAIQIIDSTVMATLEEEEKNNGKLF